MTCLKYISNGRAEILYISESMILPLCDGVMMMMRTGKIFLQLKFHLLPHFISSSGVVRLRSSTYWEVKKANECMEVITRIY